MRNLDSIASAFAGLRSPAAPLSIGTVIRCRRLSGAELGRFADVYRRRSGLSCDVDYLARAQVWATFDADGRMMGGWVLNCALPFRYSSVLPPGRALSWTPPPDRTCEIACTWFHPELGQPGRVAIYLRLVSEVIATGRPYILAGTTNLKIMAIHRQCLPHLLYAGPGATTANQYVYFGEARRILVRYLAAAGRRCLGLAAPAWSADVERLYTPGP